MRRALGAAVLVAGVGLFGCGVDVEQGESDVESRLIAPKSPAHPSAGDAPARSAVQTVRVFIQEVNRAGQDGDTRLLRELFTDDCENCQSVTRAIERIHASGGDVLGPTWVGLRLDQPHPLHHGVVGVAAHVRVAPQTVIASSGQQPVRFANGDRRLQSYTLVRRDGRWRIVTFLNAGEQR